MSEVVQRAVLAIADRREAHLREANAERARRGLLSDHHAKPSDEDIARAVIEALRYVDGIDEDIAIAAGRATIADAVTAIECHEAWIDAVLAEPSS